MDAKGSVVEQPVSSLQKAAQVSPFTLCPFDRVAKLGDAKYPVTSPTITNKGSLVLLIRLVNRKSKAA